MKVTVVGAGNMGRGIATRVLAGGHEVEIVDRDADFAAFVAEDIAARRAIEAALGFAS